jgi:hypothetical protein
MRKRPKNEEVFYEVLVNLIKNQLIIDPNFKSVGYRDSWYERNNEMHYGLFVKKAEYILQEIESIKHLIIWEEDGE